MASSPPLVREDSHDCFRYAAATVGQAAAIIGTLNRERADPAAVHARLVVLADRSDGFGCELLGAPDTADRCALGRALHSVVVHLRTAAERANRHRVTAPVDELAEVIDIVAECGQHTARSLTTPLNTLLTHRYRSAIRQLADDADDAFRRLFARWYFDTDDLTAVAGMRDLGDELENVVRAFEEVADAVLVTDPLPG
ncbi:hypothetical protein [Nocardia niwae]|uniref:Uncharacterized protein n=1 Tax=Nocardia niwae TaxID=626084 RepID=A0ABV2XET2_9NOCA|nr:hypothetical protein [Nocardia niwae]